MTFSPSIGLAAQTYQPANSIHAQDSLNREKDDIHHPIITPFFFGPPLIWFLTGVVLGFGSGIIKDNKLL